MIKPGETVMVKATGMIGDVLSVTNYSDGSTKLRVKNRDTGEELKVTLDEVETFRV